MIIFKGVPGIKIEKELNSLPFLINKKKYVWCQQNSWGTYVIFNNWLKDVYKKYEINSGYKCILILDHEPSHHNPNTIEFMKNNGIEYVFVPQGLTRKALPLDISVNGPFKSYYKNFYTTHIVNTSENLIYFQKTKRNVLIDWINDIWYSQDKITKKTIFNSFIKSV